MLREYRCEITFSHNKVFNRLPIKIEFFHCDRKVAYSKFQEYLTWFMEEYNCKPIVHENHHYMSYHTYHLYIRDEAAWVAFKLENS